MTLFFVSNDESVFYENNGFANKFVSNSRLLEIFVVVENIYFF